MSEHLSPNTKAILLLTAPLIAGRSSRPAELLTPAEYKRLARRLREIDSQPADLLTSDADQILEASRNLLDPARLSRLLERGFLLSQAVERWQARAIWVVSRADLVYPQRLKDRLKGSAPPLLYGCGERQILESGGLAVVGSRHVTDKLIVFTLEIGRQAASAGTTIVSGGARGIDQASMRGALEAGGRVVGVLADSLERAAMHRDHRSFLLESQLVLISPYDPAAGFNVGHAMQRNKLIYALADAALVVNAETGKGGTWAGATEQLDRLRLVPVYVRSTGNAGGGLEALRQKGALPWPNPSTAEDFEAALRVEPKTAPSMPEQASLPLVGEARYAGASEIREPGPAAAATALSLRDQADAHGVLDPAGELFAKVQILVLQTLEQPRKAGEIADALDVTKRQAEIWLERLVAQGLVEKMAKPVRYAIRPVVFTSGARSNPASAAEG